MRGHQTPPPAAYRPDPDAGRRPAAAPLLWHARPAAPRGALLFLHGGRSEDLRPVSRWSLPAARMSALRRAVAPPGAGSLLVASVRYRHRGWNGQRADAADDARRALAELRAHAGGLPIVLVGHSMGARAALRCADHPRVAAVIALAPWCPRDEPAPSAGTGTRVFLVHGDRDRITSPADTWAYRRRAGPAAYALVVPGGDHAMLRHARVWRELTALLIDHSIPGDRPLPAVLDEDDGPVAADRAIAALRRTGRENRTQPPGAPLRMPDER